MISPYLHCPHHWRPVALDHDASTGCLAVARYACALCPAWQEIAGTGLTLDAIAASDSGPLDDYLPAGYDDYFAYPFPVDDTPVTHSEEAA